MNIDGAISTVLREIGTIFQNSSRQLVSGAILDSTQHVVGRKYDEVFESKIGAYGQYSRYPFKDVIEASYKPMSDSLVNSPMLLKEQNDINHIIEAQVNRMYTKLFEIFHKHAYGILSTKVDDDEKIYGIYITESDQDKMTGEVCVNMGNEAFSFTFKIAHRFSSKGEYFPAVELILSD